MMDSNGRSARTNQRRGMPGYGERRRTDADPARLPRTPARLRDPEVGAEPRAQVQEDRTQASLRGEARGDRRALVHDQEVTGAQEPRQVLEAGVLLAVGQ